jgi:hypothetical protein
VRLYISEAEAQALADHAVPLSVAEKCKAKLKPAAAIEGQTTIYDHLEDTGHEHDDLRISGLRPRPRDDGSFGIPR